MPDQRPIAVITGASSGIGEEFARQLASRGYDLVLVARRSDRLETLAGKLRDVHQVECAAFEADLANRADRDRLCDALAADKQRIALLVNNAGFGTHGFFHETDLDRELELIDVNCAAPVHLTKRILPWMLALRRGYIMNVASLSAFTPGPIMAMYFASKAFLLSFSEALWEECRDTGVTVTALCPGPVRTEFQRTAGLSPKARSSGTAPVPVERVVDDALRAMFNGRRVVIPGYQARIAAMLSRITTRTRALRAVRRIQEQRRNQSRQTAEPQ
ncbi:MAG TPA: SDR family oxidoreductase [Gemmatimonadaceae bacterium]